MNQLTVDSGLGLVNGDELLLDEFDEILSGQRVEFGRRCARARGRRAATRGAAAVLTVREPFYNQQQLCRIAQAKSNQTCISLNQGWYDCNYNIILHRAGFDGITS